MFMRHGGGRAGPHEYGWVMAGYKLDEIEPLRQQLLVYNDIGQVQKAMRQLGIRLKRATIEAVKKYNFDSQGLGFVYENYAAWRRLATGNGTIGDAAYLIHEISEIEELLRIKSKGLFDFMKTDFKSIGAVDQWAYDFNRYYLEAHSKALEAEYEFIAEQVFKITNGRVKISKLQAAAIDPSREEEALLNLWVDGVRMYQHHHFLTWRKRALEVVPLRKRARQQLGYYQKKITIENLIRLIRNMQIN
jgi:hypothetical protein